MKKFYVVHTKPRQERKAERNLRFQGFKTWLPTYKKSSNKRNQTCFYNEPFFPGYFFVIIDILSDDWFKIQNTYGVKYLVSIGGKPKSIENSTLSYIKKIVNNSLLEVEDNIEITCGKLNGKTGKILDFYSKNRVKLLLDSLSGKITTILQKNIICKI